MSLKLVIGKSGSGKSEYIYNSILEDEKQGLENTTLFVPETARIVAEKEYLYFTKKKYISDIKITTINREISREINKKELYKNKKYLPKLAKQMCIKNILSRNPELFNIFKNVKDKSGFIQTICSYFDIFDRENIDEDNIKNISKNKDYSHLKLLEILNIYTLIKKELRERFVDSQDEMDLYILQNKENRKNKKIYFDLYNNFSKKELEYIKLLLDTGADVTITLNMNIDLQNIDDLKEEELGIFKQSKVTYNKLKKVAEETRVEFLEVKLDNKKNVPEDLMHLQNNIFDIHRNLYDGECKNVEIKIFSNIYEEIKGVAQSIYNKQKEGTRYKEIGICTNNIDAYETSIIKIFNEYKIPFFANTQMQIKTTTLATYILALFEMAIKGVEYIDNNLLFVMLKTGLSKIKEEEIFKLENYVNEFGIKGYMYNKFFYMNRLKGSKTYNLDELNKTRENIIQLIKEFEFQIKKSDSAKQITESIYNHLKNEKTIDNYVSEIIDTQKEQIERTNKKKQVLEAIYEVLDCINIAETNKSFTSLEYLDLLKFGFENQEISTIPTMLDQVEIFDLNKNKIFLKDDIYIIGVNENELPKLQNSDSFFSDKELEIFESEKFELKNTSLDRLNMELFNIYMTINKCKENVVFTIPASKMTGEILRLSPLIKDIKNVLNVTIKSNILEKERDDISKEEKYNTFLYNIVMKDKKYNIDKLYTEYCFFENENDEYKKILEYARKDQNLKKEILDLLYSKDTYLSVSRLEELKRCPFAYYLKYILNIKKTEEYKISKLDMGSIMHEILEKTSRYIVSKSYLWQEIYSDEKVKENVKSEVYNIVENLFQKSYTKYNESVRQEILKNKLKKSMFNVILVIAESFNQSEFQPLGYEVEFDCGKLFAPIEVVLDSGKKVYLKGKIDRIDIGKINQNNYIRVVDYKSSKHELSLDKIREGVSLQLMTYMAALIENGEKISKDNKVYPAALNYFTINTSVMKLTQYENSNEDIKEQVIKDLKLKGIYIKNLEVLTALDSKVNSPKKSYIDANINSIENENKYLPEERFLKECKLIKKTLKLMAEEIINGKVKIQPCSKKSCEYCEYFSVCRKTIFS